jgi:hypothetical protein
VKYVYLLQIVDAEHPHAVVQFPGGGRAEVDLIEACVAKILPKRVGLLRSEAHVRQAITEGITEAIRELKFSVGPR